jgi:hypothetical protein
MKEYHDEEVKRPKFSHFENIFDNLTIISGGGNEDHHNSPHHLNSSPKQLSLTLHKQPSVSTTSPLTAQIQKQLHS